MAPNPIIKAAECEETALSMKPPEELSQSARRKPKAGIRLTRCDPIALIGNSTPGEPEYLGQGTHHCAIWRKPAPAESSLHITVVASSTLELKLRAYLGMMPT